jgi:hypothetical protein
VHISIKGLASDAYKRCDFSGVVGSRARHRIKRMFPRQLPPQFALECAGLLLAAASFDPACLQLRGHSGWPLLPAPALSKCSHCRRLCSQCPADHPRNPEKRRYKPPRSRQGPICARDLDGSWRRVDGGAGERHSPQGRVMLTIAGVVGGLVR